MISLAVLALSGHSVLAQSKPESGFDQLKMLVGEWEGKTQSGKAVRVSYRLVSAGSALLETLHPPDESEMVTVYHADGERVAVTHFCSANNQPRMQTVPISGPVKQLSFSFVGASNLASPEDGHMHRLAVTLEDKDHFTQRWTWLWKKEKRRPRCSASPESNELVVFSIASAADLVNVNGLSYDYRGGREGWKKYYWKLWKACLAKPPQELPSFLSWKFAV
jgi:hypothetical protein